MKKILLFNFILLPLLGQAQASLVKDINPGSGDGVGGEIMALDNNVYFAADDGANGFTLWASDGTETNTNQFLLGSNPYKSPHNFYYWAALNKLVFSAEVGTPQGYELWGNGIGFSDYNTTGSSDPSDISEFQGYLIFAATSTNNGRDLAYASNGGSVTEVEDINPGSGSSNPSGFTTLGNAYYFAADDGTNGRELWSSISLAPNSPNLFIDINSGAGSSFPDNFTTFNNKLYFTADNGSNGKELWTTDGTLAGTYMVLDLYSGSVGSNPTNLTVYNNALYFTATHATLGNEIFKMTGSETMTNLKNINAGNASSSPFNLFVFNSELYFAADDGNGVELWKSGGFPSNTNLLKDINPSGESNPGNFQAYNGKLYFVADNGANGRELWSTDGSTANTELVADIYPGSLSSNPEGLVVVNDLLLFAAQDATHGMELWKYQDPSLSINDGELENSISLFPNPTNNSFTLKTNETIQSVTIYDIQGKIIKSFGAELDTYSIQELNSGLYYLKIKNDKGEVTKKLIKE